LPEDDTPTPPGPDVPTPPAHPDGQDRPVVTCHVGAVVAPNLGTVDALCRLRMAVAHMGYVLRLIEATPQFEELLTWCGLDEDSLVQGERKAEEWEEPLGVEEEAEPGDPTV
jgi:hypothetical protein